MAPKGYKFTAEQRENVRKGHLGQTPWNKGLQGCKRGHDPSLYKMMPSGVPVCLQCKRENAAKYREKNREAIRLKNKVGRYKIEVEDCHEMLDAQGWRCAICGTEIDLKSSRIDHDHDTGAVRGLLCASCNTGIGLMKDSPEVLMRAAEYIRKNYDKRDSGHAA
jgi:hypothetical protein